MSDKPGYDQFIKHSQNWIFDFPDTKILRELLEMRLNEKDAVFLSTFPHFPSTIEQLSESFNISADELITRMQPLIKEGFIYEVEGRSATRFSKTDPLFFFGRLPGWLGKKDEFAKKYAPLMNQYYDQNFGQDFMGHHTKGLRSIPVNTTVDDPRSILPYEDLLAYVEKEDYHTVSSCACRHNFNMDLDREDCKHEVEVCLHFGRLGKYIVKNDMGRKIEKAETLEILKRCADNGLVHAISNTKNGMDTICNCCSCCCIFLRSINLADGVPREYHQRSNYMVQVNSETCIACGLCGKRCPIDAIKLVDKTDVKQSEEGKKLKPKDLKTVSYDPDACIGCGVCVHKCPTQSLTLTKRDTVEDIPENFFDAGMRMMTERGKDPSTMF
ncbi:MAG: 4Fe-4S binding protein [Deltaproteobacteria bacterium]|nr:4Fe-4S binding protein [Deltaproteobacteria bacterium]